MGMMEAIAEVFTGPPADPRLERRRRNRERIEAMEKDMASAQGKLARRDALLQRKITADEEHTAACNAPDADDAARDRAGERLAITIAAIDMELRKLSSTNYELQVGRLSAEILIARAELRNELGNPELRRKVLGLQHVRGYLQNALAAAMSGLWTNERYRGSSEKVEAAQAESRRLLEALEVELAQTESDLENE